MAKQNFTKHFTEHLVVRDYGKQGLAVFDMTTAANPGRVACWSTILNYEDRPKGFRPDVDAPMSFDEVPMDYYWKGKLVRRGDILNDPVKKKFLKRYKDWAASCYGTDVGKVVFEIYERDQQRFRAARWAR